MHDKTEILTLLLEELNRWEELLSHLNEKQVTMPQRPSQWSIKDVVAHLRAWQQLSFARVRAAQDNTEPVLPAWLAGSDPESEEELENFNARIYETHRRQSWQQVYQDWRDGFRSLLTLAERLPNEYIMDPNRYDWLNGRPLFAVLEGTYEHHQEHYDDLQNWLNQPRDLQMD